MNKYPLKLEAVNKNIIWGGTRLSESYGKGEGKIAEAWELTVHPEGINVISNGEYKGMLLSDYIGSKEDFPIMIKLIDAADRLSVQVHPVKTEMWCVLEADEGATLVYGLKDKFDESTFTSAVADGKVEELLNYVPVKKGDVFFIPQGLVHAIGKGILIAEIQENSNITYRVYDYNRLQNGKPRELHVEQAIKTVKDFTEDEIFAIRYLNGKENDAVLADCSLFKVERYQLDSSMEIDTDIGFVSVICTEGEGTVGGETMKKGDSFFLPDNMGKVKIEGNCEIIISRSNT